MSDLLRSAQEFRQKLYALEVLLEVEKGGKSRTWFAGKAPQATERAAAIKRLTETGLIEPTAPPAHFRLTPEGWEFLRDVRTKVGAGGALDWTRADEIDFSKL
jgi:predicted transcriptional regulator